MSRCPQPKKRPYRSERAAKQAMKTLYRNRANSGPGRLHAYRCPAGHWHVGHIT